MIFASPCFSWYSGLSSVIEVAGSIPEQRTVKNRSFCTAHLVGGSRWYPKYTHLPPTKSHSKKIMNEFDSIVVPQIFNHCNFNYQTFQFQFVKNLLRRPLRPITITAIYSKPSYPFIHQMNTVRILSNNNMIITLIIYLWITNNFITFSLMNNFKQINLSI